MKRLWRSINCHAAYACASLRIAWTYKGNFWVQIIGIALLLVIQISLWTHLDFTKLSGERVKDVIRYLVVTQLTALFLSGNATVRFLSERVKNGQILVDLLRPLYLVYLTFAHQAGLHLAAFLFVALPNLVFAVTVLDVRFNTVTSTQWQNFVLTMGLSYLLAFLLGYLIGIFSLWIGNIWGIKEFYDAFALVMGGTLVPLTFYPSWLQKLAGWFPFQSIYYTPASYLGGLPPLVEHPILFQAMWVTILVVVNIWLTGVAMNRAVLQGG